jgi:hypothetical protein
MFKTSKHAITLDQKNFAWDLVNNTKIGKRGDGSDGTLERQYAGFLAETVYRDMCNAARPRPKGFDHGVDFVIKGKKVDLKTQIRKVDVRNYYVNNLMASQVEGARYENDIYLFSSINKETDTFELIGWVSKKDVKELKNGIQKFEKGKKRTRGDGTEFAVFADMYEVPNSALELYVDHTHFFNALADD